MNFALEQYLKKVITIPEYYTKFIDNKVNLIVEPKVCCPFHGEDTPSFSYSHERGVWACFGACKTGGDVINMHKKNKGLRSREEAANSLAEILQVDVRSLGLIDPDYENKVNKEFAKYKSLCAVADKRCKGPDDWLELDYLLSFNKPFSELIEDLNVFIENRNTRILH